MAIPNWMKNPWNVAMMNGSNLGTNTTFNVDFDQSAPFHVKFTFQDGSSTLWGTLETSSVVAGATRVTGYTSASTSPPGQPFHIDYTYINEVIPAGLNCYLDDVVSRRTWLAAGLGVIAGTLLGGVVGFGGDAMLLGATAGLAAVTAGFLVAHGVIILGKAQGGGSTPTWVASDPGITQKMTGQPGPQSVVRATA